MLLPTERHGPSSRDTRPQVMVFSFLNHGRSFPPWCHPCRCVLKLGSERGIFPPACRGGFVPLFIFRRGSWPRSARSFESETGRDLGLCGLFMAYWCELLSTSGPHCCSLGSALGDRGAQPPAFPQAMLENLFPSPISIKSPRKAMNNFILCSAATHGAPSRVAVSRREA